MCSAGIIIDGILNWFVLGRARDRFPFANLGQVTLGDFDVKGDTPLGGWSDVRSGARTSVRAGETNEVERRSKKVEKCAQFGRNKNST